MPKNRIRELRQQKGLSAEALAERIGISRVQVTRMESGSRGVSIPNAEAIAMALDATVADVLGLDGRKSAEAPAGLAEEAEEYRPGPSEIAVRLPPNHSQLRVRLSRLDQLDINDGDIVTVDYAATSVEAVPERARSSPAPVVVVAIHFGDVESARGTTILRQFVPPNLLITNSRSHNERMLNIDTDDVHIRGVVVLTQRSLAPQRIS